MYTKSGGMRILVHLLTCLSSGECRTRPSHVLQNLVRLSLLTRKLLETRDSRLDSERREVWLDTRVALHEFLANLLIRPYNLVEMLIGLGL